MSRQDKGKAMSRLLASGKGTPLVLLTLVALSFALNWYYLGAGFQADEFFFINTLRFNAESYSPVHGLWSDCDSPGLTNLWWVESLPDRAFWRPVPSLVFVAFLYLFGMNALPLHALSILLHGLVAATLYILLGQFKEGNKLGILAALFFLCCEDNSVSVGWIATNTDIICALFINLSFICHARYLATGARPAWIGACIFMIAALLSKESAVLMPVGALWISFCWSSSQGQDSARLRSRIRRVLIDRPSWISMLLILVAYLVAYHGMGYGIVSSGMYINPFESLAQFAQHAATQFPILCLALLSPVPPSLLLFTPEFSHLFVIMGLILILLFTVALWDRSREPGVVFAAGCTVLAILPQLATYSSERNIYLPAVFACILLAKVSRSSGHMFRIKSDENSQRGWISKAVGIYAFWVVLIAGFLLSAVSPLLNRPSLSKPRSDYSAIVPMARERQPQHVVVLNTPGPLHTFYGPEVVSCYLGEYLDLRVLSSMNGVMHVERINDRTFDLSSDRSGWFSNIFASMLRSPVRLEEGGQFVGELFKATIIRTTRSGLDPLSVRFEFSTSLNDPGLLFVNWNGKRFVELDMLGLAMGEQYLLADTANILESFY